MRAYLAPLFLLIAAGCGSADDPSRILGVWSLNSPLGDRAPSSTIEFKEKGELVFSATVMDMSANLNGRWSLSRGILTISGLKSEVDLAEAGEAGRQASADLEGTVLEMQLTWKNKDAFILSAGRGRRMLAPGRYDRLSPEDAAQLKEANSPLELDEPVRD